jgi:membrane protease YdiL (CAAX protease family)
MRSRLTPWQALIGFAATWIIVEGLFEFATKWSLETLQLPSVRGRAAVGAAFGVGLMWTMLGICVLFLRWRGQTLADVGWRRPATTRSWWLAVALVVLVAGGALFGPLGKTAQLLSDWSFYRISLALIMGATAGICLETVFRGFIMTQARDAGMPTVIQVTMSAVLCALVLARFAYGSYPTHPDFSGVIASTMSSVVLCAFFAVIYVVGRRSLNPAIAAHAAIDMVVEPGLMLLAAVGGVVR